MYVNTLEYIPRTCIYSEWKYREDLQCVYIYMYLYVNTAEDLPRVCA